METNTEVPTENESRLADTEQVLHTTPWHTTAAISVKQAEPTSLTIVGEGGKALITISLKDGSLIFGEGYTPTEAARVFWQSMSGEYRQYLAWKAARADGRRPTPPSD